MVKAGTFFLLCMVKAGTFCLRVHSSGSGERPCAGYLHDHLLGELGEGKRDGKSVAKAATAAKKDGIRRAGALALEKAGAGTNVLRDTMRHARRQFPFLRNVPIYWVDVPFAKASGLGVATVSVPIILPHELFATLFALDLAGFQDIFGSEDNRVSYWNSAKTYPWFL